MFVHHINIFGINIHRFETDDVHFLKYRYSKEFSLMGYNAIQCGESQPTFQWNISLPSSGLVGFLLGLLFDPEDGDNMFLRNVG
jgi:hypothetical protein